MLKLLLLLLMLLLLRFLLLFFPVLRWSLNWLSLKPCACLFIWSFLFYLAEVWRLLSRQRDDNNDEDTLRFFKCLLPSLSRVNAACCWPPSLLSSNGVLTLLAFFFFEVSWLFSRLIKTRFDSAFLRRTTSIAAQSLFMNKICRQKSDWETAKRGDSKNTWHILPLFWPPCETF